MKLGEVCLLTHDVPRLAAFYRALLGVGGQCDDPVHQFLTAGEPSLTVYNDGQEHSAALSPVALAFTVEDIQAAFQKLTELKADILQPPARQPWGAVNLIFRDPDGNQVYLRQLPTSEQEDS